LEKLKIIKDIIKEYIESRGLKPPKDDSDYEQGDLMNETNDDFGLVID